MSNNNGTIVIGTCPVITHNGNGKVCGVKATFHISGFMNGGTFRKTIPGSFEGQGWIKGTIVMCGNHVKMQINKVSTTTAQFISELTLFNNTTTTKEILMSDYCYCNLDADAPTDLTLINIKECCALDPYPTVSNTGYIHNDDDFANGVDVWTVIAPLENYLIIKDEVYTINHETNKLTKISIGLPPVFEEIAEMYNTPFGGHCDCGACTNQAEALICLENFNASIVGCDVCGALIRDGVCLGCGKRDDGKLMVECDDCGYMHWLGECTKAETSIIEGPSSFPQDYQGTDHHEEEFTVVSACMFCSGELKFTFTTDLNIDPPQLLVHCPSCNLTVDQMYDRLRDERLQDEAEMQDFYCDQCGTQLRDNGDCVQCEVTEQDLRNLMFAKDERDNEFRCKCGTCKKYHRTPADVKECYSNNGKIQVPFTKSKVHVGEKTHKGIVCKSCNSRHATVEQVKACFMKPKK